MRFKITYDKETKEFCYVVRIKREDVASDDPRHDEFEKPAIFEQECNLVILAFLGLILQEKIAVLMKDLPQSPQGKIEYAQKNRVPPGTVRKV